MTVQEREQQRRRKVIEAAARIAQVPLTEHQKHVIRTQLRRT